MLDTEIQKSVLLIMQRSQKPEVIVAGRFFTLGIEFSTDVNDDEITYMVQD